MTTRYPRVAIIGSGPAGLAAAKALALEPVSFDTIDVFERRDDLGGIWYFGGDKTQFRPPVPSLDPNVSDVKNSDSASGYFSPMYRYLETNLISRMMEYNKVHFPENTSTFPPREQVYDYVKAYARSIPDSVKYHFNSNVLEVSKSESWSIRAENVKTSEVTTREYDAVIVANGHFNTPYVPDVPGLRTWSEKDPNSITHAKYFDTSSPYKDKNVLVVGSYASGLDLGTQLSVVAKSVTVSVQNLEEAADLVLQNVAKVVGLVASYDYEKKSAYTEQGTVVSDIDAVIFCTGYLYGMPFLKKEIPGLITDGSLVNDIYKQIFYIPDPSLSFIGLPKFVIPMPLAESQSALVARVYSGRFDLPSKQDMESNYLNELKEKGEGKTFHNLKFPADADYCTELNNIIGSLLDEGLQPPVWDEQRVSDRKRTGDVKSVRLLEIIEHAKKLREAGEDFRLLGSEKV